MRTPAFLLLAFIASVEVAAQDRFPVPPAGAIGNPAPPSYAPASDGPVSATPSSGTTAVVAVPVGAPATADAPTNATVPAPMDAAGTRAPALSEAAKQRIAANLKTVEANLTDVRENLATTKANLKTIQEELGELDSLEKEHVQLKKKYETYLTTSRVELTKTSDTLAKLDDQEKALGLKAGDDTAKAQLASVQVEKQQKTKWRDETQTKVARTESLMIELLKNLRDIQARREPLKGQLQSWAEREKEYERLTQELTAKKTALEKSAAQ